MLSTSSITTASSPSHHHGDGGSSSRCLASLVIHAPIVLHGTTVVACSVHTLSGNVVTQLRKQASGGRAHRYASARSTTMPVFVADNKAPRIITAATEKTDSSTKAAIPASTVWAYDHMQALGLQYGRSFACLQRIAHDIRGKHITATVSACDPATYNASLWCMHPGHLDAAIHAPMVVTAATQHGESSALRVPVSLANFVMTAPHAISRKSGELQVVVNMRQITENSSISSHRIYLDSSTSPLCRPSSTTISQSR